MKAITFLSFFLFCSTMAVCQKKPDYMALQSQIAHLEQTLGADSVTSGSFELFEILTSKDTTISKDNVFERMKFAVYKNFRSGDHVLQYESKEEGRLLCRSLTGNTIYMNNGSRQNGGYFTFDITILCKQGKAKVSISNITHTGGSMTQMRDGSDFGDTFPSAWKVWRDGMIGKKVNEQSQDQWNKIKLQAKLHMLLVLKIFQDAMMAKSSTNDF